MTPFWLSAFLDYPADRLAAGTAFWSEVTGYPLSSWRGPEGEFATLVPPDGDDYLRVQRVGDGAPRVHLDLHVDDPRAVPDGATVLADHGDHVTCASPGGLTFCLVTHPASVRPRPGPRASMADQVCLDVPPGLYDEELAFWTAATGWARRDLAEHEEFERLEPPASFALRVLVQRLDAAQPAVTAHLDWAAADRAAEVEAHVAAGATAGAEHDWWTVMTDPAGLVYCITRRPPTPGGIPS